MKTQLLFVLPFVLASLLQAEERKPNVVIFLADDMGYADCGAYGSKDIPTPNIDSLAANGVRFLNAYTSGCVCSPTRAGLMTGRYQQRFGFDANAEGAAKTDEKTPRALDIKQTTFAQRMKAEGYATALIGKWHLGATENYLPTERGFDEFYGFLPFGLAAGRNGQPVPIYRGKQQVEIPTNHMESFCDEAISFIERQKAGPFFLYLPFPAVHGPFVGPEPYLQRFQNMQPPNRAKYAADLTQMDDIIGRVMARLRATGLERDTLVFFLSDNGGAGGATNNGPLRSTKWWVWEGGIRVPFIVQWKGRIEAGRSETAPVIQLDILPTALAAAGAAIDPSWKLDGVNLLPLLENKTHTPPHEALYWRFGVQYAVRQGDWKLIKPHINSAPKLFNLAADVGESSDLAAAEPERLKALQGLWDAWNAQNEPPRWIDLRWNGDGPRAKKKKRAGGKGQPKKTP